MDSTAPPSPQKPLNHDQDSHLVGSHPGPARSSTAPPTDPAGFHPAGSDELIADPASFHPSGSIALLNDPSTLALLPPRRPTNNSNLRAALTQPGDLLAMSARRPRGSSSGTPPPGARVSDPYAFHDPRAVYPDPHRPGDLLAPSGSGDSMSRARALGLRVSEALGLGNQPAQPGSHAALEFLNSCWEPPSSSSTQYFDGAPSLPLTGSTHALSAFHTSSAEHSSSRWMDPYFDGTRTSLLMSSRPHGYFDRTLRGESSSSSWMHGHFDGNGTPTSPSPLMSSSPAHPGASDPAVHTRGETSSSSQLHLHATPSSNSGGALNRAAQPFHPTAASSLFRFTGQRIDPIDVTLLTSSESAVPIIDLLDEGDHDTRLRLLAGMRIYLHVIMENGSGRDVFNALLRCCKHDHNIMESIVQTFVQPNDAVWRRWTVRRAEDSDDIWMSSLQMLFSAVSEYPDLCETIVNCLVRENILCNARGAELLKMCFDSFRYHQAKTLIHQAVQDMSKNLQESQFGSKFLEQCFSQAEGDELRELENAVLNRATEMAKGKYSTFVLQHAVKYGTDGFLHNLLMAFYHLTQADLAKLVSTGSSSVVTMLTTGMRRSPTMTRRLAENISMLPTNVLAHPNAKLIVKWMNRVLG